jgi:hypothetical protein
MAQDLFVAIGLGWGPGEDAEAVEIGAVHGPFMNLDDALTYAASRNHAAELAAAEHKRARIAYSTRRHALFGDKYPLSDEEGEQLGRYPPDPDTLCWHAVTVERPEETA